LGSAEPNDGVAVAPMEPTPEVLTVAQTLAVDRTAAEVISALDRAGIRGILLKGASLAEWLYEEGPPRSYRDCDVLVAPPDIDGAEAILSTLGFEHPPLDDLPGDKPWHAHAWERNGAASIDLHRTLIGVGVEPEALWAILSRHTARMHVGGRAVEVLDEVGRAMHVALHAAHHGVGIRHPLRDLERAVRQLPIATWRAAAALAAELGATAAFAAGLRLDAAGALIADSLALPREANVELLLRSTTATPTAVGFEWLMRTPGIGRKLRIVLHKMFPPPGFMRAWTPLARRGVPGLVLAYLWRPVWLLVRLGPSARAWWRARRQVANG
jgi:hypothetical protein